MNGSKIKLEIEEDLGWVIPLFNYFAPIEPISKEDFNYHFYEVAFMQSEASIEIQKAALFYA